MGCGWGEGVVLNVTVSLTFKYCWVGGYFLFELAKSCDFRSILMMVMVDTVDDVDVRMLVG